MKSFLQFVAMAAAITMFSCARQSSPTGGPKDTIPPTLLRSEPYHEQINYQGKSIELTFSELIELANAKEQIIITPTIGKDYEVDARNEKVILKWERNLQPNTTYTFNFRESVKDITERNPAKNLRVAISTGSYIDSLELKGNVTTLEDEAPLKDATVALQPYSDTFNIQKHQPVYFTKTDDKGNYKLENLKPGDYILYSITDQNRNLLVDSKSEQYGFKSDKVTLDTITTTSNLAVTKVDLRNLKVTSARPYNTYFNIKTSKNLATVKITSTDTTDLNYTFGADRANVILYNTFPDKDSLQINLTLTDSIENKFDTTLYAKFSKQKPTPEKFVSRLNPSTLYATKGFIKTSFTFSKPLAEVNFDSLLFLVDSTQIVKFEQRDFNYDPFTKILTIEKNIDPKLYLKDEPSPQDTTQQKPKSRKRKQNLLYAGRGAFISIEKDSSAVMKEKLNPLHYEDLGVILCQVRIQEEKTFIELINSDKQIIRTVYNNDKASFEDLIPGDYMLRVIIDKNGNGKWDKGNYLKKIEPEPVVYYKNEKGTKEIKLKANFEIGPLLITY